MMEILGKIGKVGQWTFATLMGGLFPQNCLHCEGRIEEDGDYLCGLCRQEIQFIQSPYCNSCGAPAELSYDYPTENFACGLCRDKTFAFDRARSLGEYEAGLKKLIQHFKYQNQPGVMREIAPLLQAYFPMRDEIGPEFYVSPVPLHFRKMKERTFDQSFLIAREVARQLNLPLANGLLRRVKDTESQAGKTKTDRAKNIKGAFEVDRADRVAGKDILLIDDVLTTGATVNEAARVLKRAKARRVYVFTLARVDG